MAARPHKKQENGFGMDILWPPAEKGDQDSDVDIVFVHGLNGKRHATWSKGNVLWPRDLLAKDFPTARIMTWGYDARIMQFFGTVGQGSIHDHANELNNDLRQERVEPNQIFRPLIFFAHSLGGLVVKSALFRSYLAGVSGAQVTDHCAAIEKSTAGVIFAGTPHRGSDQTKWARSATNMAKVMHKDHSSRMSQALERGSQTLEQLGDFFKSIQYNFNIFTFTEELPCPKIGRIVEPDSAKIDCEHEKTRMIHANHMEMVRHDDRSSNEYKKMKDAFQQMHQQLSRHGLQATRQRASSLNGSRNSYVQVPDEYLPRDSIQPGPADHAFRNSIQQGPAVSQQQNTQQRTIELGRVNTVATEYLAPSSRRPVAVEASPRQFYQIPSHRASTTTLGTVASTSSRGSDQSGSQHTERQPTSPPHVEHRSSRGSDQSIPRLNEHRGSADSIPRLNERPPSQHQPASPPPPQPEYLTHLNQGTRLVRLRGPNFAQNLPLAHAHFTRAITLLGSTPATPSLSLEAAKIKYQLMNLEFESAFNRQLSPQEKLAALARSEQWGWEARDDASTASSSPSSSSLANTAFPSATINPTLGSTSLLAQITLYLSILHGRVAEVSSRLGVPPAETTRKKSEAVTGIIAALDQIRERCPGKLVESEKFAKTWVERLGGTWVEEGGGGQDGILNGGEGGGGAPTPAVITTPPPTSSFEPGIAPMSTVAQAPSPAPATSATVFPSAAELDSAPPPRASMADLSYFAELDISGRLVPAQYIQREDEADHQQERAARPGLQHNQHIQPQQAQPHQERQSLFSTYNYDINSNLDPGLGVSLGLGGPSRFSIADYEAPPLPSKQPIPQQQQQQQQAKQPPQSQHAPASLHSHPPNSKPSAPPSPNPQHHQIPNTEQEDTTNNEDPPPAYSPYLS